MQILKVIIVVLGMALTIAAAVVSQVDLPPSTYKFLSPRYWRAMDAITRLERGQCVEAGESGFAEIADIKRAELRRQHPPEVAKPVVILKLELVNQDTTVSILGTSFRGSRVDFTLMDGQTNGTWLIDLRNEVQQWRARSIVRWSLGFLVAAILFTQLPQVAQQFALLFKRDAHSAAPARARRSVPGRWHGSIVPGPLGERVAKI